MKWGMVGRQTVKEEMSEGIFLAVWLLLWGAGAQLDTAAAWCLWRGRPKNTHGQLVSDRVVARLVLFRR